MPKDGDCYSALIANMKGYKPITKAIYGGGAICPSQCQNRRAADRRRERRHFSLAKKDHIDTLATIATCFQCPLDAAIDATVIGNITAHFLTMTGDELIIADSVGAANPQTGFAKCRGKRFAKVV